MIAWHLILEAALITGAAVALAAQLVGWKARIILAAAAGAFVSIVAWRAIANAADWNGDFVHLVSVGDVGSVVAGAAVPALLARIRQAGRSDLVPAVFGGVVGFLINVVIL